MSCSELCYGVLRPKTLLARRSITMDPTMTQTQHKGTKLTKRRFNTKHKTKTNKSHDGRQASPAVPSTAPPLSGVSCGVLNSVDQVSLVSLMGPGWSCGGTRRREGETHTHKAEPLSAVTSVCMNRVGRCGAKVKVG